MDDAYLRYHDPRQPYASSLIGKRPRPDYGVSGGPDMSSYYARDDYRYRALRDPLIRDTDSIGASYDRYLQNSQVPPFGGAESARTLGGGIPGHLSDDPRMVGMDGIPDKARSMGYGGGPGSRPEIGLPPDASSTLFVEGLPSKTTRREVSHIFRPFVGYKEVRLVSKEARNPGSDPLLLCFVDFLSPGQAATAMDALQGYQSLLLSSLNGPGYKFDDQDADSVILRVQFARYPGSRTSGLTRGKR